MLKGELFCILASDSSGVVSSSSFFKYHKFLKDFDDTLQKLPQLRLRWQLKIDIFMYETISHVAIDTYYMVFHSRPLQIENIMSSV